MDEATGRAKGGVARAEALTPNERKEIAKKAAAARWSGEIPYAEYGASDRPIRIGNIEIGCYVLSDERRVITFSGMVAALGMSKGGQGYAKGSGDRISRFLTGTTLIPFVHNSLLEGIGSPIRFRVRVPRHGARNAFGYEATLLADICEVVLAARRAGSLQPHQFHIADRCELLLAGFSRIGIIALVDEATGFQFEKKKRSLAEILEAFIAKELRPWLRTFPDDFYKELFRLRDMEYPTDKVQRPRYFGLLTNDIVYDRLAPGVADELRKVNPKTESGRRKHKNFQWLTSNIGYPKLREHLGSVVAIMKLSLDWYDFRAKLDKLHPHYGKPTQLSFEYADEEKEDTGKGL
jgi:hypothetical protein